jgi:GNAT superfamily N-acetyltransferase
MSVCAPGRRYAPAMQVRDVADPMDFLDRATGLLMQDEARHNLQLGILGTLRDHPEVYPDFHLWLVEDGPEVQAVAIRTPPFHLTIARPRSDGALATLAGHLAVTGAEVPGVVAAEPEASGFARAWTELTGARTVTGIRQGGYRLTEVLPVPAAPGRSRLAAEHDHALLEAWFEAFLDEALPDAPRRSTGSEVETREGKLWLWEVECRPVSLAGFTGPTPNGVRVGPVYTPPDLRGRGYATSLVAEMSAWLLASGRTFCFLFTDLANPTSNSIYRRIGYEHVFDAAELRFEPASG